MASSTIDEQGALRAAISNHQCSEPSICTSSPRHSRRAPRLVDAPQPIFTPNPEAGADHPLPKCLDPEIQAMKLG